MHKEDGQMLLTHTYGPMPPEQQMIVETMHQQMKMTCPMSRFCNTPSVPTIQNQHHFGCPAYVLKKEIQDHKKIRKWSDRTRIGITLGYSSRHELSVSLILNLQTGLVSPQYHCQYDDLFETTMGTQARSIPTSQWQFKAGFTSDKPDISEKDEPSEELWDD
jgi:hypothetical protein